MFPGVKFTLHCEVREDGGLRVHSDIPGLVLSGQEPTNVMADVWPAVVEIMEAMLERGCEAAAQALGEHKAEMRKDG